MIKYLLIVIGLVIAFYLIKIFVFPMSFNLPRQMGYTKDFYKYFDKLKESNNEDSFLIITIKNSDDFIQFRYLESYGFNIDFPFVTEKQKSFQTKIADVCKELNLPIEKNKGSDGTIFFDIYLKESSEAITDKTISLFQEVFSTTDKTEFEFQYNGFNFDYERSGT